MGEKVKDKGSVVKIDSSLLDNVEEFIKKDANKFKFTNKKQFIDIAVHEFLNKLKSEDKDGK